PVAGRRVIGQYRVMSKSDPEGFARGRASASEVDVSDEAVADVVAKELALLRPAVRGDRAVVDGLLHEAFREFGASGRTWDRSGIADTLATDPGDVAAEAEEMRAVRLGEDVIFLTY